MNKSKRNFVNGNKKLTNYTTNMKCENKECVMHTEIAHGVTCPQSGKNKCQDCVHNKTCWDKYDMRAFRLAFQNLLDHKKEIKADKSKLAGVIKQLYQDKKKIVSHGTTGEAVFMIGDYRLILK